MANEAFSSTAERIRTARSSAVEVVLLGVFVLMVTALQALFRVGAFIENPRGPRDPHASAFY